MSTASEGTAPASIDVPRAVRWIVARLEEEGYETWAVGGAVRDALRGRPSQDWDLATRAPPEEVRRIFPRTVPVGVEHGTVGVLTREGALYEVTTFRRDVETFGRHAVVAFAETLEEDLQRRDFTINALAWHPLREELRDPHGGARDLQVRVLRTVGDPADRFAEDYLRVLRALRFAGRFGLEITGETWRALRDAASQLGILSPERIREELWKVLSGDPTPGRTLELYRRSGALAVSYPELARVAGAGAEGAPEWTHTLSVVGEILPHRTSLRVAVLLGDLGTPAPTEEDPPLPRSHGPARDVNRLRAMVRAAALLMRLRHSNLQVETISGLVGAGPELPSEEGHPAEVRRWLSRVGRERVPDLVRWAAAEARMERGKGGEAGRSDVVASWHRIRAAARSGHPLTVGDLAVNGRDLIRLGLRPGPQFGDILEVLLERVLHEPGKNRPEVLEEWALELASKMEGK